MSVGIVTAFEYNGQEYSVPTTKNERRGFTNELIEALEQISGVVRAYNAGETQNCESVRIEIELQTTERCGLTRLNANPRSVSQKLRHTIAVFSPVSSMEVVHTPTPKNAQENLYDSAVYIVDVWFY